MLARALFDQQKAAGKPAVAVFRCDRVYRIQRGTTQLALARFKPWILFVDHIETSATTHYLAVSIARFQRLQRTGDFHDKSSQNNGRSRLFINDNRV
jgi:hypothetical protein